MHKGHPILEPGDLTPDAYELNELHDSLRWSKSVGVELAPWQPQAYPRGSCVLHRGGTWRADADVLPHAEPQPKDSPWTIVANGAYRTLGVSFESLDEHGYAIAAVELSDGTILKRRVHLATGEPLPAEHDHD